MVFFPGVAFRAVKAAALGFSGELSMACDTAEAAKGAFLAFLVTLAGALALGNVVCNRTRCEWPSTTSHF